MEDCKKKIVTALVLNAIMVVLGVLGIVFSIHRHGIAVFEYYTENSNYFSFIVSCIYCVVGMLALKNKTTIAKWVNILRFVATTCLTVTFIVVIFVLIPMDTSLTMFLLFEGSSLYQHLLCPIISVVSFLFFENYEKLSKNSVIFAVLPTLVYGVVTLIFNGVGLMVGPYPFLMVTVYKWYEILVLLLGVVLIVAGVIAGLYFLHNRKFYKKKNKNQVNTVT